MESQYNAHNGNGNNNRVRNNTGAVRYVAAALESACKAIANAQQGGRNDVLNSESFGIGQLVGAGVLEFNNAETALLNAAADNGMKRPDALPTIRSGLKAGMRSPREIDGAANAPKRPPVTPPNDDPERYARYAAQLYREAKPITGTIVGRYLREARGIPLTELPANIRWHPGVKNSGDGQYYPAMIAPIVNTGAESTRINAVHVTWVDPQTAKKTGTPAKKMYGSCKGGAIWLEDYAAHMLLAEGIEKTLFCMEASGIPGVVGLSATLLPSIVWPRATTKITICADPNGAGERAINRAAAAWTHDGVEVCVCYPPEPGKDWDECALEAVSGTIAAARTWRPPRIPEAPAEEDKAEPQSIAAKVACMIEDTENFEHDENGKLLKNEHNVRLALKTSGVTLSYDEFACEYRLDGLEGYGTDMTDDAVDEMYLLIQREYKLKPAFEDFFRAIKATARRNRFDPVCQYLDRAEREWDGVERLDEWLHAYMGAENTPLNSAFGAKHMIAAVRRARKPGCKYDNMLVLEGHQRSGKSSCILMLCPHDGLFTDALQIGAPIKEVREATQGKWLVELAELDGMSKREASTVKAMISRQSDSARMAYERMQTSVKRRFVMWGTCNDSHYLRDATGNRRFWPVHVENDDPTEAITSIIRDRDQLWGEAAARETAGESLELPDSLREAACDAQEERLEIDPWEEIIRNYALSKEWIPTEDIYDARVLDVAKERRNPVIGKRISAIFMRMGWVRIRRRFDTKRILGYAPKETSYS